MRRGEMSLMLSLVLTGAAAFLAWMLGASFIQVKTGAALFSAAVCALLSALAAWLMCRAGLRDVLPAAFLGLFLLGALSLQLQGRAGPGGCTLAFCLALGAFFAFVPLIRAAEAEASAGALAVGAGFCAVFAAVWAALRGRFPGAGWQEYFGPGKGEQNRLDLRKPHVYAAAAALCAGNALLLSIDARELPRAAALSACGFLMLWGGVLLIILMTHYKKERLTVLLEQQYREETQAFMNVIRSQRHDYNFHVQTIAGLIAGNRIEECRAYVRALEKDSAEMNALMPIKDPAISATIFSFRSLAVREGIALRIDIEYDLSQIATNVYETNKILSNLLRNALDEVSTHADKSYGIGLTILKRGEYCVIRVSNKVRDIPTAEQLGRLYEQGYTTKTGHEGVGLSSIRLLAARYRGIVFAQMEGDVIHFIARIPINTSKREEC